MGSVGDFVTPGKEYSPGHLRRKASLAPQILATGSDGERWGPKWGRTCRIPGASVVDLSLPEQRNRAALGVGEWFGIQDNANARLESLPCEGLAPTQGKVD